MLIGEADEVTRRYLDSLSTVGDTALALRKDRQGPGQIRFTAVRYLVNGSLESETVATGDKISVVFEFECRERIPRPSFVCSFFDPNGACALLCESTTSSPLIEPIGASGAVVCEFDRFPLLPGTYRLNVAAKDDTSRKLIDRVEGAAVLEVTDGDFYRTGHPPRFWAARVVAPHKWRILHLAAVERK
jgi:hypothetical protein